MLPSQAGNSVQIYSRFQQPTISNGNYNPDLMNKMVCQKSHNFNINQMA